MLMCASESCLVLTERPTRQVPTEAHKKIELLLAAARELEVPVLPEEGDAPGSALSVEEAAAAFKALGRRQAVLADMAPGSPIAQIAAKLLEDGFEVFVVADLAAAPGLNRRMPDGAVVVTTEMVVYEWLGRAGTETFRKLLPLIR